MFIVQLNIHVDIGVFMWFYVCPFIWFICLHMWICISMLFNKMSQSMKEFKQKSADTVNWFLWILPILFQIFLSLYLFLFFISHCLYLCFSLPPKPELWIFFVLALIENMYISTKMKCSSIQTIHMLNVSIFQFTFHVSQSRFFPFKIQSKLNGKLII